jgi:hypothetical protein
MANGCETTSPRSRTAGLRPERGHRESVEICAGGGCDYSSCDANWLDCAGGRANGCETDGRLLGNCGSCGNTCPGVQNAVEICASGSCDYSSCDAGWLDCSGGRANGCESSRTSFPNCGTCGNTCPAVVNVVTRACVGAGTCGYAGGCNPGFDDCNSLVTDG